MWGEKIFYEVFRQKLIDKKDVYEINFYIEGEEKYNNCTMGYIDDDGEDYYCFGLPVADEKTISTQPPTKYSTRRFFRAVDARAVG